MSFVDHLYKCFAPGSDDEEEEEEEEGFSTASRTGLEKASLSRRRRSEFGCHSASTCESRSPARLETLLFDAMSQSIQ